MVTLCQLSVPALLGGHVVLSECACVVIGGHVVPSECACVVRWSRCVK